MCSLPPSYRHLLSAWDNVPCRNQTIEYLTLQLLREEVRNKMQDSATDEGETAFLASRSGTSQKALTPEEKKKRAARIAELKSKTKCKACGKVGH
jgi:hypothetical protein